MILTVGVAYGDSSPATYKVTIKNLTKGQPLTPPAVATHREGTDIFAVGQTASSELKEVAENGNLDPLVKALTNNMEVSDVLVAVAGEPPPLLPGKSITFMIEAGDGAQFLSFVSMLICTNDGFTGLDSLRLPEEMDGGITVTTAGYDAGTEINSEDFADLVPPCPALTGVESMVEGSGESKPALAEGDVIRLHPGIQGGHDLAPMVHGWTDPVAEVVVERVDQMMMPEMMPQTGEAGGIPVLPLATLATGLALLAGAAVLRPRRH
jgi:hypothetical protein